MEDQVTVWCKAVVFIWCPCVPSRSLARGDENRALTGIRLVAAFMVLSSSPQKTVNLAFSVNDAAGREADGASRPSACVLTGGTLVGQAERVNVASVQH